MTDDRALTTKAVERVRAFMSLWVWLRPINTVKAGKRTEALHPEDLRTVLRAAESTLSAPAPVATDELRKACRYMRSWVDRSHPSERVYGTLAVLEAAEELLRREEAPAPVVERPPEVEGFLVAQPEVKRLDMSLEPHQHAALADYIRSLEARCAQLSTALDDATGAGDYERNRAQEIAEERDRLREHLANRGVVLENAEAELDRAQRDVESLEADRRRLREKLDRYVDLLHDSGGYHPTVVEVLRAVETLRLCSHHPNGCFPDDLRRVKECGMKWAFAGRPGLPDSEDTPEAEPLLRSGCRGMGAGHIAAESTQRTPEAEDTGYLEVWRCTTCDAEQRMPQGTARASCDTCDDGPCERVTVSTARSEAEDTGEAEGPLGDSGPVWRAAMAALPASLRDDQGPAAKEWVADAIVQALRVYRQTRGGDHG